MDGSLTNTGGELIVVEVHGQRFAVDIMQVREIRGWSVSTPLPGAPDDVLGIVNLRGSILPVIDLAGRLSLRSATPNAASVVIVTEIGTNLVGLLVDAVCDIYTLEEGALLPIPEIGGARAAEFVRGVFTTDDGIVTVLALEGLAIPAIEQKAA
jgi:purine-binding chemotaxis protein CheW